MNLSYWEHKHWFRNIDFAIIGSGIVGLNCALNLRKKYPKAKIVVFEKGLLPEGASTKNAGFACFGSVSEILDDLTRMSESEVLTLIDKRCKGIQRLQKKYGTLINYKKYGGYELFFEHDESFFNCFDQIENINKLLKPIFKTEVFNQVNDFFGFKQTRSQLIFNRHEGQIDTGLMMRAYLKEAIAKDIFILNNCELNDYYETEKSVEIMLNQQKFEVKNLLLATNGFASALFPDELSPARAQVLITKPIKNLHIKGTFHIEQGYYYFRNYKNRLLFGGARNLAFDEEKTTTMQTTSLIQNQLETVLKHTILPEIPFEIDQRWTGIMGVGKSKVPIVKQLSTHVYCGVKLGGMGVAIGAQVGKELAELCH